MEELTIPQVTVKRVNGRIVYGLTGVDSSVKSSKVGRKVKRRTLEDSVREEVDGKQEVPQIPSGVLESIYIDGSFARSKLICSDRSS